MNGRERFCEILALIITSFSFHCINNAYEENKEENKEARRVVAKKGGWTGVERGHNKEGK